MKKYKKRSQNNGGQGSKQYFQGLTKIIDNLKNTMNTDSSQSNSEFIHVNMRQIKQSRDVLNTQEQEDLNDFKQKNDSLVELDSYKLSTKYQDRPNGIINFGLGSPINTLEDIDQNQANYTQSGYNMNKNKETCNEFQTREDTTARELKSSNRNFIDNKVKDEYFGEIDSLKRKQQKQDENEMNANSNNNEGEKHVQINEVEVLNGKREKLKSQDGKTASQELVSKAQDQQRKGDVKKTIQGSFKLITLFLPKMKKFLETKTYSGRTRFLSEEIRQFIDDISDYEKRQKKKNYYSQLIHRILDTLEDICYFLKLDKIPLFDPENLIKLFINTIIVTYNCFFLFLTSVEVCFSAHFTHNYLQIFHSIAYVAWVTEMLLQMNTATYHHNTFTNDRKIILRIYVKEYFFFEILPLLFEGRTSDNIPINILLHLPILLKIKGIMIILKKLEFYALQVLNKHYILFLFKLCAKVIILGHIIACSRNILASFETHVLGIQDTWENEYGTQTWHSIYLECLYWSFAIMMHNLSEKPKNDIEYIYSCLIMLLTSIIFGYMLTSIGTILADISKQTEEYKKDLNILNSYMKRKNIEMQLYIFFNEVGQEIEIK